MLHLRLSALCFGGLSSGCIRACQLLARLDFALAASEPVGPWPWLGLHQRLLALGYGGPGFKALELLELWLCLPWLCQHQRLLDLGWALVALELG